jgi:putative addiction module component (TIGR02574 family)
MEPDPSRLLEDALKLPPEARAALAGSLLDSLEEGIDAEAESEWEAEIARRVQQLDSGVVSPIPWSEARKAILGQ